MYKTLKYIYNFRRCW